MKEELSDLWLQKQETSIHLFLCDCYSNVLLEVLKIEIDPFLATYIQERLKQQKRHCQNAIQVQKQIEHIMDATPTKNMSKRITMHKIAFSQFYAADIRM